MNFKQALFLSEHKNQKIKAKGHGYCIQDSLVPYGVACAANLHAKIIFAGMSGNLKIKKSHY